MGWGPFSYGDHDRMGRESWKPVIGLFVLVCKFCGKTRSDHKRREIRSCNKQWKEKTKI